MGSINTWPLDRLVSGLAKSHAIANFVETGTFEGDGCAWASSMFATVTTIEKRRDYHEAAKAKLAHLPIDFRLGDSRDELRSVVAELTGPALFWLDGHAGAGLFGPEDDCPLMQELSAVTASPHDHFIVIDDARAFLAPPPPPFVAETWPNICEVIDAARHGRERFCVVIADAVICVPPFAKETLIRLCNEIRPTI